MMFLQDRIEVMDLQDECPRGDGLLSTCRKRGAQFGDINLSHSVKVFCVGFLHYEVTTFLYFILGKIL